MNALAELFAGAWWAVTGIARCLAGTTRGLWRAGDLLRRVSTPRWWPVGILPLLVLARWGAASARAWMVALAALAVSAVALAALAGHLGCRAERVYTVTCLGAVTVWFTLTAALGTPQWLTLAGAITWVVLALPWWLYQPRPQSEPPSPLPPQPEVLPPLMQDWRDYVQTRPGGMSGARLTLAGAFEHGMDYRIDVVPGAQHLGTFQAGVPSLTTALNIPAHRMVIECPDLDQPRALRFRHVVASPIERPVYFTGPRMENGRIVLGPYADGMDTASWRLFTTNSMWGGFILGSVGSGKSRMEDLIALTARDGGCFIIYIDGQNGASSPTLWEHADWRGGTADAEIIRLALERGKNARQTYNRVHKLSGFTPGGELTPVLVIIDECHDVYLPHTAKAWSDFNRQARKVGMANVSASQFSGLDTFGGSDVLRSSLIAGNAVALRTSSAISAQLIPGLDTNPALFPTMPGYGYYVAASKGSRTAPFRAEWLPDEKDRDDAEARGEVIPVLTVEEWFTRIPRAALDELTARAFGEAFLKRAELAAKRDADDQAWLEGREQGECTATARPAAETPAGGPSADTLAAIEDTATAIEHLLTGQEQMTLRAIIEGLSRSGKCPTVFTVRAALNHLTGNHRLTRDGDIYRKGEAA